MTSRSRLVAKAFGSSGVLSKATQAVPEAVGGGAEEVANTAALGTGTVGEQKFVTASKSLYVYDGSEWDQITGAGSVPFVQTEPPTTVQGLDGFTPGATTDTVSYTHLTLPTTPYE